MTPARKACLIHYGRICRCCGERRLALLEIDHVDGFGGLHRRQLYPWKIEHALEAAGFPASIHGHRIRLLCQRCHRSRTKSHEGDCMIDHTQDMPAEERLDLPIDRPSSDSIPTRLVKVGGKRQSAEATVMLSIRVKPGLKERFERHSQNGSLTNPEILEHLLDLADGGEVTRYREVIQALARLAAQQDSLISYVSELKLFDVTQDIGTTAARPMDDPDPFAHRDPQSQTWAAMAASSALPSPPESPPPQARWWFRRWPQRKERTR